MVPVLVLKAMNIKLLILFCFLPVSLAGQYRIIMASVDTSSGGCTTYGAESRWDFENDGDDLEGNHNASLYGDATWDSGTKCEGSYSLSANGDDDYATLGSINYTSTFTITGEAYKSGGSGEVIIWATSQSDNGWELRYDVSADRLILKSGNGSNTAKTYGAGAQGDLDGSCFMWMAVIDYDTPYVTFYINGTLDGGGSITYTPSTFTSTARIGCSFLDADEFYGNIDCPQLYLGLLTATDASTINSTPLTEVTYCE